MIIQKNRALLPGEIRTFVFDDFIHVVDSLLYLFPYPVERWVVTGGKKGDFLYHVVVQGMSLPGTALAPGSDSKLVMLNVDSMRMHELCEEIVVQLEKR